MSVALRPRHRESPRARRLAASEGRLAYETPPDLVTFAVAEIEIDLTRLGDDVTAYVSKAVVDCLPVDPVHLLVEATLIRDAGDLSLAGMRRALSGSGTPSRDITINLVISGLVSEIVPPSPGQIGTIVVGSTVERPTVVRLDGSPGIAVRSFARLTFSYDHRTLARADAVRFLTAVKHRLETS